MPEKEVTNKENPTKNLKPTKKSKAKKLVTHWFVVCSTPNSSIKKKKIEAKPDIFRCACRKVFKITEAGKLDEFHTVKPIATY